MEDPTAAADQTRAPKEPDPGPPELLDDAIAHRTASPAGFEPGTDRTNPLGIPGPRFRGNPFTFGFWFALGALVAYALFEGAAAVSGPLLTITVAVFLAVGLDPIVSRLEARGIRRGFAIAIVFVGFVLLLAGFVALIVPTLVTQLLSLVNDLPGLFDHLQQNQHIQDLDNKYQILDKIRTAIEGRIDRILSGALGAAQVLASVVFNVLTITILTLYFLAAFHPMKEMAYRLAPASRRARVTAITDAILLRAGGYVTGQLTISAIAGLAAYLWLRIAGVHFASALALLISVFSLIPMVGATIGSVIVSVVAATQSLGLGIATLVFFIIYQQTENYLIYPRVMRRAVNVHPAGALVGALIGGSLLGFVGAIIAVPVVAGIQLVIEEVLIPRQETA